ncbi:MULTISPECIES: ribosome maturation factor RimM [unclassified Achromobacter]|uniref:ribosome maturation factor RimM n=1 Tax=unclassified Achromobacter TaxID=2626865 RepID=UPI000B51E4A8|nr:MULTISPECIES: ribosome maturation factor RimM [unclassified Achromobacter]OWT77636.1 ribosome maturation factor RimM [Achromobacter sp. HZ28]OWT78684.1 ribosome maturation factor RimM [Achromobacter sp. HZ34]
MPENTKVPAATSAGTDDLIELGRISGAYGVRGWVKVQPHSAQADVLLSLPEWRMARSAAPAKAGQGPTPAPSFASTAIYKVQTSRPQGATVVAQLAGIADRDQAEALRGMAIYAPRSVFPEPEDDEFYWVDLIGCTLYGEQDGAPVLLGLVEGVLDNGAHSVLRVARQNLNAAGEPETVLDAKGRPAEVLVPFVQAHVHTVDIANRRIDSDWPLDY